MSRVGKKIISHPEKVKVEVKDGRVFVQGPKGSLDRKFPDFLEVHLTPQGVQVKRKNELRSTREQHGLFRTLLMNMMVGVSQGFEKRLEIIGLGMKAQPEGEILKLSLGFTEAVNFRLPPTVQAKVEANTKITLFSPDKELLGSVAAMLRNLRLPEPYKGTGIKYHDEVITRKVGKSVGAVGA